MRKTLTITAAVAVYFVALGIYATAARNWPSTGMSAALIAPMEHSMQHENDAR